MRVVILTSDQPQHNALCRRLAEHVDIDAIVISDNIPRRPPGPLRRGRLALNALMARVVGRPFLSAWRDLQSTYREQYPNRPDVETIRVKNVNDRETVEAIQRSQPDLVVVSGTNIVGREIIALAGSRKGIVNLHTGISPYVKGGPNCTNWCLAERAFHLIGNTVMWLDAGIDSGKIIATERTPLSGRETLPQLHLKVMEHAHGLYVRAIRRIATGASVPAIPQDRIAPGRTYTAAEWDALAMLKARAAFSRHYRSHFDRPAGRTPGSTQNVVDSPAVQLFPLLEHAAH